MRGFGYPPLVTPTSQIVGAGGLNVVMGERYKMVTKESRALVGEYENSVPIRKVQKNYRRRPITGVLRTLLTTSLAEERNCRIH